MNTYKITYTTKEIVAPLNWKYFLTHYVIEPIKREDNSLVRLFKVPSGKLALVNVTFSGSTGRPEASFIIRSEHKFTEEDLKWIKDLVSWCYDFTGDVSFFYDEICRKDPVLKAACEELYGAKLRTDPDVFESVIGVVLAQNVQFQRIYKMSELLCKTFGESMTYNGTTYYTFPSPERLAKAKLSDIRACKVGYRDKYIKGIAEKIVREGIDLNALRKLDDGARIREKLTELPGVGPYTADLAIAIGFRRPSFHLDLFSREAMYTFYFGGKKIPDEKIMKFVDKRWGKWKHHAMLLLTTNTDTWAKKLGKSFRLKSGAKTP